MTDRENVIGDLEEQIAWIRDNDFHKFPGWGHAVLVMRAALELLKVQEPRVMTPQELMELPHGPRDKVPVCVEERAPVNVWNKSLFKWCGSDFAQEQYREHGGYYTAETYGRLWRCWTGMPTRKEREAVKWDD